MKEFLTVKEFSKLSGIAQTTLRHWDEIGLFRPARRDPDNGYRYYSPQQVVTVKFITTLSSLHVPLKSIRLLADCRNPQKVLRLIEQQEKQLDMEMNRLLECYSIIHTRLALIKYGIKLVNGYPVLDGLPLDSEQRSAGRTIMDESRIDILYREDMPLILGLPAGFAEKESFVGPFLSFCQQAKELRINLNYPIGGYHESMDSFLQAPGQPDRFFSLDPTGNSLRPAGNYLVGFTRGYYGECGDLPARMTRFVEEHAIRVSGPVYSLYLHDEISLKDPSQYLLQVCVAAST